MSTETTRSTGETQTASMFKQSETLFLTLVESSPDVVVLRNAEGHVLYVTASIERLLGYSPGEFQAMHLFELIHPDNQTEVMQLFTALIEQQGKSVKTQYRMRHKNGSWRWIEGTWTNLLETPAIKSIMLHLSDITESKQIEEHQHVLNVVSERLVTSPDHDVTLQEIAELLVPSLADYCRIAILDDQRQVKAITANHIYPAKIALVRELYEQYKDRISPIYGLQRILKSGKAELISAITPELLAPGTQENSAVPSIVQALGLQSYMGVPLIAHGRIIGAITLSSIQPHRHYTRDDLAFAQEVARRIALALDNARLYREAQEELAQRTQVEAALKQSEEQLRAIFIHTAAGISFTDAQGRILQVNPAFCRMIGYTEEELYQTDFQRITHPDDLTENLRLIQELADGKVPSFVQRKRYLKKDGGVVWVRNTISLVRDEYGNILHLIALIEDITESKQAEEERSRLAAIVEASEDAIIGKTPDGVITSWNQAAERMFGYTAEEAIGKRITLILPPELHQQEEEIIDQVRRGIHIQPYETVGLRKDGTRIDVSLSVSPVKDGAGDIVGAAKIARDITERKELEQRKDEFISMASHELKTPVTSIKGFTQLLQRRFRQRDDAESLRFLARMDTQLDKLTKLINDLLDVSKMQTGQLEYREEPFELDELVAEIMENIQGTTPNYRLVLEKSVPARILGDRDRIGQVLINLLNNAIKYSPGADQVIVRVETDGTDAVVSVQDFGMGIAHAHQKKIFERFYQVGAPEAKTYSGLGIGLYISSEIVRRHGGRIWVKSRKGEGSTFSFSLPLMED